MRMRIIRLATMLIAFALAFTTLPVMGGSITASAAALKAPAQVKGLRAAGTYKDSLGISWKKLAKNVSGYEIFRNGKSIAKVGKNKTVYVDTGLKAGAKYKYQVRAYSKSTQYYNSKTKKWVNKKPKKSQWKGKKKRDRYKYGKKSVALARTTKSEGGSGGTGSSGDNKDVFDPSEPLPALEGTPVTDYLGKTWYRTAGEPIKWYGEPRDTYVYKRYEETYDSTGKKIIKLITGGSFVDDNNGLARYDSTIDGEFWSDDFIELIQKNGAAFKKSDLVSPQMKFDIDHTQKWVIQMYGGDPEKLTFEIDNPTESSNKYNFEYRVLPVKVTSKPTIFVMKGEYRLAEFCGIGRKQITTNDDAQNLYAKSISFYTPDAGSGSGLGFVSGDITIIARYNGEEISKITFNPNSRAGSNGLSPLRQMDLDIALAATGGVKESYEKDMIKIENYVFDNYEYPSPGNDSNYPLYVHCGDGAHILETYSIYKYGEYGIITNPPDSTFDTHKAFFLNSDIEAGIYKKYETQGHGFNPGDW